MGYGGGRAFMEAGQQIAGLGDLLYKLQRAKQQDELDAADRAHRLDRERLSDADDALKADMVLAEHRGGHGTAPRQTPPLEFGGMGMEPNAPVRSPLAPPVMGNPVGEPGTDEWDGADIEPPTAMFKGRGIGMAAGPLPEAAAPPARTFTQRLEAAPPDPNYTPVGDGAYIMRPEVQSRLEADEKAQREIAVKEGGLGRMTGAYGTVRPDLKPGIAGALARIYGDNPPPAVLFPHEAAGVTATQELATRRQLAMQTSSAIGRLQQFGDESDQEFQARRDRVAQDNGYESADAVAADLRGIAGSAGRPAPAPHSGPHPDPGAMAGYPAEDVAKVPGMPQAGAAVVHNTMSQPHAGGPPSLVRSDTIASPAPPSRQLAPEDSAAVERIRRGIQGLSPQAAEQVLRGNGATEEQIQHILGGR